MSNEPMTVEEILQELRDFNPRFPRRALSEAVIQIEDMIPHLLDALDYAADHLKELMETNDPYNLHIYAMFLLAQFHEMRAFPKLIRLMSHKDEDSLEYLFGDSLNDDCPVILNDTFDGQTELLEEMIENQELYIYSRAAALDAYGLLAKTGVISKKELLSYLRALIYERLKNEPEGSIVLSSLIDIAISQHLFELIPDIRDLYDRDIIDIFISGGYDDFINYIFDFHSYQEKQTIKDTVAELEGWACYKEEPEQLPPVEKQKKIGRNDPCPCGSGKKYKKCCLNKPAEVKDTAKVKDIVKSIIEEKIEETEPAVIQNRLAKRIIAESQPEENYYDDGEDIFNPGPYDLMTGYPDVKRPAKKGEKLFTAYFNAQGIEIDIPVYKALHHRKSSIFTDRNRDMHAEDLERIGFLLEAFVLFADLCEQEQIPSFAAFDERYMVHFASYHWVSTLYRLLTEYQEELPEEKRAFLSTVSAMLEKLGAGEEK